MLEAAEREPGKLVIRWNENKAIRDAIAQAHADELIGGPRPKFDIWNWKIGAWQGRNASEDVQMSRGQALLVKVNKVTRVPNFNWYSYRATPVHARSKLPIPNAARASPVFGSDAIEIDSDDDSATVAGLDEDRDPFEHVGRRADAAALPAGNSAADAINVDTWGDTVENPIVIDD